MDKYDVIVIGAGPAGASAARTCAKNGLKTLLLEKEKIPREKRCAGGISRAALDELDFELPEDIVERKCYGMTAFLGKFRNEVKNDSFVAVMVTRSKFDAYLTDKARESGADVHDNEECLSVNINAREAVVTTKNQSYSCNIVISADGVHSKSASLVRPAFKREQLRYCLVAEIPLAPGKIYDLMHDTVFIWYGFIDMGYAWLFPKRDYISAGIGGTVKQSKNLNVKFSEFLKFHGLATDIKMKGCLIPVSDLKHDICSDRIMITGDSAGLVDDFSGEGVRFAIASGRNAGKTAVEAHNKNNFSKSSLMPYQTEIYGRFRKDLRCSISMTDLAFSHPNLILSTAVRNDSVIKEYFKTMTGKSSFKEFSSWFRLRLPYLLLKRLFK